MNKYLLWIAVVIVIAAAALFFTSKTEAPTKNIVANTPAVVSTVPEQTTPTAPVVTNTVPAVETPTTVTYTKDGFSPEILTVKSGTKVTFINQNDSPMWVASGPHPAHTLYPEFDAKVSVQKGSSYSFTFIKVGTHPYHNHVLLGKFGKIIVE